LCFTQQQARVDFTVHRKVQRNMPGTSKKRVLRQLPVQALCRSSLFCAVERAAGLA
jgi:hypothetical protein